MFNLQKQSSKLHLSDLNILETDEQLNDLPEYEQWRLDRTEEAEQCRVSSASPPPPACFSVALSSPPPFSLPFCCHQNHTKIKQNFTKKENPISQKIS